MSAAPSAEEFLACVLARMITGLKNVAVGTNSPIAATAALLVQAESGGATRASAKSARPKITAVAPYSVRRTPSHSISR